MVLEVATITILPDRQHEFLAAYRDARHLVAQTDGCRSMRMTQGIESPATFILLVEWDSVEAHEQNFRASERFAQWRAMIGPFFAVPPHVEHFDTVD